MAYIVVEDTSFQYYTGDIWVLYRQELVVPELEKPYFVQA
jgi:hypothetical protein